MARNTQEIAEACGCSRDDVRGAKEIKWANLGKIAELPKSDHAAASHATDPTPPIYNIWKQQNKTEGSSHFGNSGMSDAARAIFRPHHARLDTGDTWPGD
ncbi:hypothetical protein [Methylocystis sp.]|uniref:hypothetical protein n=1 Tax=Methylocystis sp. TaxID=1911079 RepID=UPI003DA647FE